jgi:glycine oxidase
LSTAHEPTSRDVIVVGAGAIGLSIGWRAAQRRMGVLVIDAGQPAAGATGVAAGMLAPVTEADFGEEALTELNMASALRWPAFAEEVEHASGEACGYRRCGTLAVAVDRDDAELMRRVHGHQRALGLDAQWLSGRECRRREPGLAPGVAGGVRAPGDHQVDPRALARALSRALAVAGGELRAGLRATRIEPAAGGFAVELAEAHALHARCVVLATGAESSLLDGLPAEARVPLRPVKGQILRLRARAPVSLPAQRVVRTPEVYAVPRGDGELVVGATVEERGFDRTVTAGGVLELLRRAYEVLPGLRPATPDNGPVVGESAVPGLWWASGHWRNGILLAPLTADAVAGMLAGDDPPAGLEAFGPSRFTAADSAAAGVQR